MIYSDGSLTVDSAKLIVNSAKNDVPVLRQSGNHWSVDVKEIFIRCPRGYQLRISNTSGMRLIIQGCSSGVVLSEWPRIEFSSVHHSENIVLVGRPEHMP